MVHLFTVDFLSFVGKVHIKINIQIKLLGFYTLGVGLLILKSNLMSLDCPSCMVPKLAILKLLLAFPPNEAKFAGFVLLFKKSRAPDFGWAGWVGWAWMFRFIWGCWVGCWAGCWPKELVWKSNCIVEKSLALTGWFGNWGGLFKEKLSWGCWCCTIGYWALCACCIWDGFEVWNIFGKVLKSLKLCPPVKFKLCRAPWVEGKVTVGLAGLT